MSIRAILFEQAEVTSISARKDRSVRFSVETGELTDEHRAAFFKVQGINVRLLVTPEENDNEPPMEVKSGIREKKTPGQMLRAVLYVFWRQQGEPSSFEEFYAAKMEKLIDDVKKKLDPF